MVKTIVATLLFFCSPAVVTCGYGQGKAAQKAKDDQLLNEYLTKNSIKATKTHSGLYYEITRPGTGKNAFRGNTVTVSYTGRTLDGTVFDSNVDPKFNHVAPFTFALGMGKVIKGWDEGIQLLNQDSKATLYIPSGLAYGERGSGNDVPPNAVLIFDIQVVSIEKE